ncbi:MAG TPA: YncE family protein [Verrucomicrobiae bacterium]
MKPVATFLLCIVTARLCAAETQSLRLAKTIPLPGVKGRFDHFAIDTKGQRLFVAALGNNTLEVLDVAAGKRTKTITGLHKPTGILYLATANQIGIANGDDRTFKLFDGTSYALTKTIGSLDDADNVRFDARTQLIYVGYGDGALATINSATMKQRGSIKLAAHPESFQMETNGSRIFVNVPDAKQVAVVDRAKKSVVANWPMTEFKGNFPMALDEANHRLFVGCRQPAQLVVLDTAAGKLVANLAISGDTDDVFYDAARKRLYISCGEGFLDVIESHGGDRYERVARIPTRAGARTCFFSSELNQIYLAVPQRDGQQAEIRIYQPE